MATQRYCICGKLTSGSRCSRCKPQTANSSSSTARGYDGRWKRVREAYVTEHPCCQDCEADGRLGIPVEEVHHIIPVAESWERRHDFDNLVGLCKSCHARRHGRTVRSFR